MDLFNIQPSKNYYRIMPGRKSVYAEQCHQGGFIGADYDIKMDLTGKLSENWREFIEKFIPKYLETHPEKTKIGAGLACGMLWTIAKGIQRGDIILSPNGFGSYVVGVVEGDYQYQPGEILPHRRRVTWFPKALERSSMSQPLQNSSGSIGTVSMISKHGDEIERLIGHDTPPDLYSTDETVEDPAVFALEKHLEDFLVQNWNNTVLGKDFIIFEEEGEKVGQQYPSDTGNIDILAISKDRKELLVVELKRGRASDSVVGQIQRYMGYVKEVLAEEGQTVRGVIIALGDDLRIRRALAVTNNIEFYRYEVSFKLFKAASKEK